MESIDGKQPGVQVGERMAKWLAKQPGGKDLLEQTQHPEVQEDKEEKGELPQLLEAARGDIERINAGTVNPPVELHPMAKDAQAKVIDDQDVKAGYEDEKRLHEEDEKTIIPAEDLVPLEKPIEGEVDEQKRREMITQNLEIVLDRVPVLARSSTAEHDKYTENIDEAKSELFAEGIDVDKYIWAIESGIDPRERNIQIGQHKAELREIVRKMRGGDALSEEEAEIAKIVNISPEVFVAGDEEPALQPVPELRSPVPHRREVSTRTPKIQTEADVRNEIDRIGAYVDPSFRARAYVKLAERAHDIGASPELVNAVTELSKSSRSEQTIADAKKNAEVSELKEIKDDAGWVAWGRKRLALYLDPDSEQAMKLKGQSPFAVEKETLFGRNWQDGLLYMPEVVRKQMELEFKSAAELRQMFLVWKKNHESLKNLANEESTDVPTNELVGRFLNNMDGEHGVEREGSKRVALAISLYSRMASTIEGERSRLESDQGKGDGLDVELPSIFNTVLSTGEIAIIRKKIAEKCGGEYYEALGLILAKMMGIAARGSSSLKSGIVDADCLGKLIFTRKCNYWSNEEERTNMGKRMDRWLPDEMCNNFLERNETTGDYHLPDGSIKPIRIAVDAATLQTKGKQGERAYYLRNVAGNKTQMIKELPEGEPDSGTILSSLMNNGELDKVDWKGSSFELLLNLKKRNVKSLSLYTMLRETITSGTSLDVAVPSLTSKKDVIDQTLVHYGSKTKQWVGYLYLDSWIRRHSGDFLRAEHGNKADVSKYLWSKNLMGNYIDSSVRAGLITKKEAGQLKGQYRIGFFRV